ncbi:TetR/AcrR family transcriptional regulator [Micromonospora sp. 067-2]|uniref:TetR/AcrR family transcriptional regulator n=1 Tax=Micromonospora sp. 067-2 TaxID=2789270 RepID=UPI003979C9E1
MGRTRGFEETAVLHSMRDRFWTYGYEGTSTYDLMDVTGLGKGSIYHAFGGKHDLYLRIFADYCTDLVADARSALGNVQGGSPLARIEHYLTSLAEFFGTESPRRGCFLSRATGDLAGIDEAVAAQSRRTFAELAGLLAATVTAAQEAGEVAAEVDAVDLGWLLLSVIRGIDTIARAGVDADVLHRAARTALVLIPRTSA